MYWTICRLGLVLTVGFGLSLTPKVDHLMAQVRDSLNDAPKGANAGIVWLRIDGGSFEMGSVKRNARPDEAPVHTVIIMDFEISKTEVNNEQYLACVEAGSCTLPHWEDGTCWAFDGKEWKKGKLGSAHRRPDQPVVCVDYDQAAAFAAWVGGRLLSEAEWEFAARSRGQDIEYPWGTEAATCARAVMNEGLFGCGLDGPREPCTRTRGNTEQGVCDMAGNVAEFVSDSFQPYPSSGATPQTVKAEPNSHVYRGGGWLNDAGGARTTARSWHMGIPMDYVGIRVARSAAEVASNETRPEVHTRMVDSGTGIEWIPIPGGSTGLTGYATNPRDNSRPITLDPFLMSKTEVTFSQYQRCVDAGVCSLPHVGDGVCAVWGSVMQGQPVLPLAFQEKDSPVVCVDWMQASTYAKWAGGRLPTDAEWGYAAKGAGDENRYPWGAEGEANCKRAVSYDSPSGRGCGRNRTWPVCTSKFDYTPQGLCDMAGNVREWTSDWAIDYAKLPSGPQTNPTGPSSGTERVVRGGDWTGSGYIVRESLRDEFRPTWCNDSTGFRVVKPVD